MLLFGEGRLRFGLQRSASRSTRLAGALVAADGRPARPDSGVVMDIQNILLVIHVAKGYFTNHILHQ
ncbi:MAG: hypothetical protein WBN94_09420 [Methanothrix sp.]